ncbi:hypothetical protein FACS189459_0410 [Bacilli bacterium]|nr:hypothetical protein FACS189459_0410 [Bacilli bacterium]
MLKYFNKIVFIGQTLMTGVIAGFSTFLLNINNIKLSYKQSLEEANINSSSSKDSILDQDDDDFNYLNVMDNYDGFIYEIIEDTFLGYSESNDYSDFEK